MKLRRFLKTASVVLVVVVLSFAVAVATNDSETVQADVRKLLAAMSNYDVDTIISFTNAEILEHMGGEAKMRAALVLMFVEMKTTDISLDKVSFPVDPTFLSGNTNEYAIIPTDSLMTFDGQQIHSVNFLLGVRPRNEEKWTYLQGSSVTDEILDALFPDFPEDTPFPEVSMEPI